MILPWFICLALLSGYAEAAQPASGPVLTIAAPAEVMVADSTDLQTWQDVGEITSLTVLGTDPHCFYRGRWLRVQVDLRWDDTNAVNVYYGGASHNYTVRLAGYTGGAATITITNPPATLYIVATHPTATEESDFSAELVHPVPPPQLTIQRL